MLVSYLLQRHPYPNNHSQYWYEIIESKKAFPLAVPTTTSVAILFDESTGDTLVRLLNQMRLEGVKEGIRRFAWWKDGIEYVGTCGTTLKQALEDLDREKI